MILLIFVVLGVVMDFVGVGLVGFLEKFGGNVIGVFD